MKTIVKILAVLCAVLMIASLAACGGTTDSGNNSGGDNGGSQTTSADPIVGSWEYESGGYIYTFNADGTGNYDAGGTVMNFTYTAENGKLSLLYEGFTDPWETDYQIDGDTLNVIDSVGNDTIYKRK